MNEQIDTMTFGVRFIAETVNGKTVACMAGQEIGQLIWGPSIRKVDVMIKDTYFNKYNGQWTLSMYSPDEKKFWLRRDNQNIEVEYIPAQE